MRAVERFQFLLDQRGWLLADGATGTNLFALGLASGDAPELWNERRPELVKEGYRSAIASGADLILTNSFGANRARLKLHQADHRSHELACRSAELARQSAQEMSVPTIVAGSMGPTGELMTPLGSLTRTEATEVFHEQAEGLKAGGAALAWIETISDLVELDCAAEACRRADLPYCATMSFDTHGRTMMGISAGEFADWAGGLAGPPLAYGANCGAGAADLVRTVLELSACANGLPLIAKGNAGIPKFVNGHVHYDGSPDLMADYAELALRAGARIIGGCCGTTPHHLRKMRERLDAAPGGKLPDHEEIIGKLGRFTAIRTEQGPNGRSRRPARRRA